MGTPGAIRRSNAPMRYLFTLLFCSCCLLAVPAFAQSDEPPPEEEPPPNIRYKEKTEIDFGERRVDATIAAPLGYFGIGGLPDRPTKPLVTLKADFNREMTESVSAVR